MREEADGGKRTNNPEGMKQRILDVAARAFQDQGYHASSLQSIMRAAVVTGGAMHHHYASKKALALAVMRQRVASEVARTWIEPVAEAPTAAAGISAVFNAAIAELEQRERVVGCPVNNLAIELSLADADFRAELQRIFADWRAAIVARIRADQAAGMLRGRDADGLATFVVAAFSGAMAMAKTFQDVAPLRDCARQVADLLTVPQ